MSVIEAYKVRIKEEEIVGTYGWINSLTWPQKDELKAFFEVEVETELTERQETLKALIFSKIKNIIFDKVEDIIHFGDLNEDELKEIALLFDLNNPKRRYKGLRSMINGPQSYLTHIPYAVIHELYKHEKVPYDRQIFAACMIRYNVWHGAQYNKNIPAESKKMLRKIFPKDAFSLDILMAVFEMELGVSTAFYMNRDFNIAGVIFALIKEGFLNRKVIHLKIFEAFNNPSLKQTTHSWVRKIHKDLAFTKREMMVHQDKYQRLVHNDRGLIAGYGLQILKKLSKEKKFDWKALSQNLEGIVYRKKFNNGLKVALDLLTKRLKVDSSLLKQTCVNLAPIFLQPDHRIQLKALPIYEMATPDEEINEALSSYVDTMQSEVKQGLAGFLSETNIEELESEAYKRTSFQPLSLNDEDRVTYIKEEEDFIFLTSKVLKSKESVDFDLFLEGLLRFRHLSKTKSKELKPALKQARRFQDKYFSLSAKAGAHHFMIAKLICVWLDPKEKSLEDELSFRKLTMNKNYTSHQWVVFNEVINRVTYVDSLNRTESLLPLLSTPTHKDGQVHPRDFVDRLNQYTASKTEPNAEDFNMALCRINRWTALDIELDDRNEYADIVNYLLGAMKDFDPTLIKDLGDCWLTAFALKNPDKAINAAIAYKNEQDWWQPQDIITWQVGRRYDAHYSWPVLNIEAGIEPDGGLKKYSYFGMHLAYLYHKTADMDHWFRRDFHSPELLLLNICNRNYSYLSEIESEESREVMAALNFTVTNTRPLGKIGYLFLTSSLLCGNKAIRSASFEWLYNLIELEYLDLDIFVETIKTFLVSPDHPIPLPRAIEQFNELQQSGGTLFFVLNEILEAILASIDTEKLPKGFSKLINLYHNSLQMSEREVKPTILSQLEKMTLISSVKKEAKKVLDLVTLNDQ